jgi:hypothetical protein
LKFAPLSTLAACGLLFTACSTVEKVAAPLTDAVKPGLPSPLMRKIGEYRSGAFDESATEIAAYDAISKQLYVTNGADHTIDVLDLSDPTHPTKIRSIDLSGLGKGANSVAVYQGLVAAAVENSDKQMPGLVAFFSPDGSTLGFAPVGALPDMLTFSPDGTKVVVANEGEPSGDYSVDPEGAISVIDISNGIAAATVSTADFSGFTRESLDPSVRVFGPNASVAQDMEPEYITVSADSKTAWVTLQENNAVAIVDLDQAKITAIAGLGFKNHAFAANSFDASNKDGGIVMQSWPVKGIYMPDAIASHTIAGKTYLFTANEGDSRDYEGFSEEERVGKLKLDPESFPAAESLQESKHLGRLKITTTLGDTDGDGDFDALYAYGARSFSVWSADGTLVYDSANLLETKLAEREAANFNSTNDENGSFDDRSDDKGPEPEGLVIGEVNGTPVLFLGLERVGGIMAFDISNPAMPEFVDYINTRNFDGDPKADSAGDLAPEGLVFIPAAESPNGKNLLVVSYEVSGSVAVFQIGE